MNYANLAQKTNFIASSPAFNKIPFFLTSINIPGLTMSHQEIGGRNSTKMNIGADTMTWNGLSFEMLIDEDFEIYKEIMGIVRSNINVSTGTFKDFYFDFFIEVSNNKGNKVLRLDFSNCRIMSFGDIQLDTTDDGTEHSMSIDMIFDYYEIAKDNF